MPESGAGISEFRIPHTPKAPDRDLSRVPGSEHPKSAKTSLANRMKVILMRVLLSKKQFRPEDYTENQIADDILTYTRNPLRDMTGSDPYANGFDKRTILSNKGQVRSMGKPNSPAYGALSQSLEQLVRDGAIDMEQYDEPMHDEYRFYRVRDLEKLRQIAKKSEK